MKSDYMKACLSAYFRFTNGCSCIATEAGSYSSDFLVVRKHKLVEVEIKVTKADLNADFRKPKHKIYESGRDSQWTPNQFYFAVPKELVAYAVSKCVDTPYGVMVVNESTRKYMWKDRVKVVKRAKKLHDRPVARVVIHTIYSRLASEMARLRINEQLK